MSERYRPATRPIDGLTMADCDCGERHPAEYVDRGICPNRGAEDREVGR